MYREREESSSKSPPTKDEGEKLEKAALKTTRKGEKFKCQAAGAAGEIRFGGEERGNSPSFNLKCAKKKAGWLRKQKTVRSRGGNWLLDWQRRSSNHHGGQATMREEGEKDAERRTKRCAKKDKGRVQKTHQENETGAAKTNSERENHTTKTEREAGPRLAVFLGG